MRELIQLFIDEPLRAILVVLSSIVLYLGLGQATIREAMAEVKTKQETYSITEQRVYETNKAVSRIEAQVGFIAEKINKNRNGE